MENIQENKQTADVTIEKSVEKKECESEDLYNCDYCEKVKVLMTELENSKEKVTNLELKLEELESMQKKVKDSEEKSKKKLGVAYVWTDKKRTFLGLPISFTRYILTETKFITRTGFFTIREDEVDLYRIIDKSFMQTLGQRIFGCGTVIITSNDKDTPKKEVKSIKNPREFMAVLEKYVDTQRTRYSVRGRDMIGTGVHSIDFECDNEEHN